MQFILLINNYKRVTFFLEKFKWEMDAALLYSPPTDIKKSGMVNILLIEE